jgi:hypothetical protein
MAGGRAACGSGRRGSRLFRTGWRCGPDRSANRIRDALGTDEGEFRAAGLCWARIRSKSQRQDLGHPHPALPGPRKRGFLLITAPYIGRFSDCILARTGESFVAPDPWNGGKRAEFTIEFYKIVHEYAGRENAAHLEKLHGADHFGIRSNAGGQFHQLPDSLSDLWRTKRVAKESLPRLLHELQPSLRNYDYSRILHHRRIEGRGGLYALCSFSFMIIFLFAFLDDRSAVFAMGFVFCGLVGLGILLWSRLFPGWLRKRCREQMGWILANSSLQIDDAEATNKSRGEQRLSGVDGGS